MGEWTRRMAEKVPACGSRTLWIGLSVGCGIVAIIMFIVAGAMGGCDCANHSCASPYEFNDGKGCTESGAGCDAKLCTVSGGDYDGDTGVETGGQPMGAYFVEIAFGVTLLVCAIVFSCGGCLVCRFGKDMTAEDPIPGQVQMGSVVVAQPVQSATQKQDSSYTVNGVQMAGTGV